MADTTLKNVLDYAEENGYSVALCREREVLAPNVQFHELGEDCPEMVITMVITSAINGTCVEILRSDLYPQYDDCYLMFHSGRLETNPEYYGLNKREADND